MARDFQVHDLGARLDWDEKHQVCWVMYEEVLCLWKLWGNVFFLWENLVFIVFPGNIPSKEDEQIRRISHLQYELGKAIARSIEIKKEQAQLICEQNKVQENISRITNEIKVMK